MAKTDPNQGALVLPATRDGRTPSGMKTSIGGAGNRITRVHELGERVVLVIEAKVKRSGHEETEKDGVLYAEVLKVSDLFELELEPGRRLLSALRQSYRTAAGEPPLTNGDETAGEGIEVALDAAMVAYTPAELAELRGDPSKALGDERLDHVVLVFDDGSRGLWPDDWAGTGQSRAPIGGTMRRPGSTKPGDVGQVVELLDATTGESLDLWTEEREEKRLLALEQEAELAESREADLEEFEALRALADADDLDEGSVARFEELRDRFEAEAAEDRVVHDELLEARERAELDALADKLFRQGKNLTGAESLRYDELRTKYDPDPPGANDDLGDPDEAGAPFAAPGNVAAAKAGSPLDELRNGDRPDEEVEVDVDDEGDALAHLPAPEDFVFVDAKLEVLRPKVLGLVDRDHVLRLLKAEEQGRGRDLKPRKGVLELLNRRAGELFVADEPAAPSIDELESDFVPDENAVEDEFGPDVTDLEG